jgi:hypothetical protein
MVFIRVWFQTCDMPHAKLVAHSTGNRIRSALAHAFCPANDPAWMYTESKSGRKCWLRRSTQVCYMGEVVDEGFDETIYSPNLFANQTRPVLFNGGLDRIEETRRTFVPTHDHKQKPSKPLLHTEE